MRRLLIFIIGAITFTNGYSQKADTRYSEKLKLEVGAYGLKIAGADNSKIYFFEKKEKANIGAFFGGAVSSIIAKISTFNKATLEFVAERDYKKELKGNEFYDIQYLNDRLFLFCTANARKDKGLIVSGFEIDKQTLAPKSELKEIASFDFDEKIEFPGKSILPSGDSNHFVIATALNKKIASVGIGIIDLNLNSVAKTILTLPADRESFYLYSIYCTKLQKLIIAGSQSEELQVGKKKSMVFKTAIIQAYDKTGKKLYTITNNKDGNALLTPILKELPGNKLLIAGFYTTDVLSRKFEGVLAKQINLEDGSVISNNYTSFSLEQKKGNAATTVALENILADNSYIIKSLNFIQDKRSIIIVAESYSEMASSRMERTVTGVTKTIERADMYYKNILLLDVDVNGVINWITIVPKNQVEQVMNSSPARVGNIWHEADYCFATNAAYYGSFKTQFASDRLYLFVNDNAGNTNVVSLPQKAKDLKGAISLRPFLLSCDYKSGVITRKELTDDTDDTVPLFPKGLFMDNSLYFPTRSHTGFDISRFSYKIGKVEIK